LTRPLRIRHRRIVQALALLLPLAIAAALALRPERPPAPIERLP
jgi:hypothetical protein